MGLVAPSGRAALELIDTLSGTGQVAVFVGSGVSAESGLPAWREFIVGLLVDAFNVAFGAGEEAARRWADSILESQQVTGAAAVVRALHLKDTGSGEPPEDKFSDALVKGLYGGLESSMFQPGPIARTLAALRRELGSSVVIVTTNYDDLLEKALRDSGFSSREARPHIRRSSRIAPGSAPVFHLHGFATTRERKGRLVLSEEEYTRMQVGQSWQEQYVTGLLRTHSCLFVGTSLVDPNLIRYLYGYGGKSERHWVVFARQSDDPRSGPVAQAREKALELRWRRCGVRTLFVDHYSDVAQLLHEIVVAHRAKSTAVGYEDVASRAERWVAGFESAVLGVGDSETFREAQDDLADLLHRLLENALDLAAGKGIDMGGERLGVSLWVVDSSGTQLVNWAAGHEVHRCPQVVRRIAIDPHSEWAAAKAYCRGTAVQVDLLSASPWGFALAMPLHVKWSDAVDGMLPVGVVQLNSSAREAETRLARDPGSGALGLGDEMLGVIVTGIAEAFSIMNPGPTRPEA